MSDYVRVYSYDNSAGTMSVRYKEQTGQRLSPYLVFPERESYKATIFYEKGGQHFKREQEVHRWGGSFSYGEWSPYTPVTKEELQMLERLGKVQMAAIQESV